MRLIDGKKREKLFFELLNEHYGPFPEPEHTDSPDFLVSFPDYVLGIECTELYTTDKVNGIPIRQHEAIKDRIVEIAKQFVIDNQLPPIHVGVFFTGVVQKHREKIVTDALIRAILDNYPMQHGQHVDIGGFESTYSLPDELHCIMAANISGTTKHSWGVTEGGCVDTNFTEQIQSVINDKAMKIGGYKKQCDKCWLIISALGFSASSFYEPSEEMLEHFFECPFERLFFAEAFSKYIVELKVAK